MQLSPVPNAVINLFLVSLDLYYKNDNISFVAEPVINYIIKYTGQVSALNVSAVLSKKK